LIPFQFHAEAEVEFGEAASFYEAKLTGLGVSFIGEVGRAIALVGKFPEAGAPFGSKLRRIAIRRFPYSIIYRKDADRLLILAVAHQSRRPGYWHNRK
jgi:plasmid stabilization system protein ParE